MGVGSSSTCERHAGSGLPRHNRDFEEGGGEKEGSSKLSAANGYHRVEHSLYG